MRKINIPIIILLLLVVFSSCNRKAQLTYMNNIGAENLNIKPAISYLLKPGDLLYVQIQTQDEKISKYFNNQSSNNTTQLQNEASQFLFGYSVSDSGLIQLPMLWHLKVGGLTINQTRELIQNETNKFLNDGIALVKLLSYRITVLGEVKSPGIKTNSKDYLTIFEGLALAGDFTDFANRSNVLLVRQTPEGVKSTRIDLHDKNIIFSDYYYLLPNDMLFIEPRKGKVLNLNAPNVNFWVSLLTTTLVIISFFTK
jgi:polysaccharide export outer membrane protein